MFIFIKELDALLLTSLYIKKNMTETFLLNDFKIIEEKSYHSKNSALKPVAYEIYWRMLRITAYIFHLLQVLAYNYGAESTMRKLQSQAEAEVVVPIAGIVVVAKQHTAAPRVAGPTTTAKHAGRAGCRTGRIGL